MFRFQAILSTAFICAPLVFFASGQDASPRDAKLIAGTTVAATSSRDPVIQLEVRRVPLDVVVTDKLGNHILGLRKDDFVVKEDGKRQRLLTFQYEDGSIPSYLPQKLPHLPPNGFVNLPDDPERGPLNVLYYDMVNTRQDDQMSFRSQLLEFVDKAEPGTQFALFANMAGMHLIQGFTSDHARLHAAILSQGPGPHLPKVFLGGISQWGPGEYGGSSTGAALANLNTIAEYLSGIPGRKDLIWLAGKFPITVGPAGKLVADPSNLVHDDVKRTYAALMKSQVAIYPVDVRGVLGGIGSLSEFQDEDDIAQTTGGQAYHGNNRAAFLMHQAIRHGESYYSMTYSPSNHDFDGVERHIEVTLAERGDYTLSYRKFYYATPESAPGRRTDTLYASIEHGAPLIHDLLFSAQLTADGAPRVATAQQMLELEDSPAYFRTRQRTGSQKPPAPVKLQSYVIDYGIFDSQLKAAAKRKGATPILEFAVAAYDADGQLLNTILNYGSASAEPNPDGKFGVMFQAQQRMDVPANAGYLRIVIRDTLTDRTGALEAPLPLKAESPNGSASGAS